MKTFYRIIFTFAHLVTVRKLFKAQYRWAKIEEIAILREIRINNHKENMLKQVYFDRARAIANRPCYSPPNNRDMGY